jgi:hypothetical protein
MNEEFIFFLFFPEEEEEAWPWRNENRMRKKKSGGERNLRDLSRATRVKLVSVDVAPSTGEQHVRHLRVFFPPFLSGQQQIYYYYFFLVVGWLYPFPSVRLISLQQAKEKNREEDAREEKKKDNWDSIKVFLIERKSLSFFFLNCHLNLPPVRVSVIRQK